MFADATVAVAALTACLHAQLPPPSGEGIVAPDAKLELLFTRSAPIRGGLTEGPAVADDGSIYFSDIPAGRDKGMILRYDPGTGKTAVFVDDSYKANGLMFDFEGHLVACEGADHGGRSVVRWNVRTKQRFTLAERFEGKRFNSPNDLCIDLEDRIYFTDPRYVGHEPREIPHRAVYRIDRDGKVIEITRDVDKPNGIAISLDQKTLYVAETDNGTDRIDPDAPPPEQGAMKIYAFALDADGRVAAPKRELLDFGDEKGCDGMTLDEKGNLYLACRSARRPGILVIDGSGKELAFIPTGPSQAGVRSPVGLPSNCVFGIGAESHRLYVTVDTSLYRIALEVRGALPRRKPLLQRFRQEFVQVTPGKGRFPREFTRGRSRGGPSERPELKVSMAESFHVAAYEVPQNLWNEVMKRNSSRWRGPRNSAEMLSFDEAVEFCRRATARMREAGLIEKDDVIRLPTETEWEYCARAGTSTLYSFGDEAAELTRYGWYTGNARGNDPPTGFKKPNPWGLYDIHGYLWEWCADPWHDSYEGAPTDGSAWTRGGDEDRRVLRGGSWKDPAEKLTSSFRRAGQRSLRDDAVGLRCVLAKAK